MNTDNLEPARSRGDDLRPARSRGDDLLRGRNKEFSPPYCCDGDGDGDQNGEIGSSRERIVGEKGVREKFRGIFGFVLLFNLIILFNTNSLVYAIILKPHIV